MRLLQNDYRVGTARAIAGVSTGGYGAMAMAARHPGAFGAAASYSGVLNTTDLDTARLLGTILVREGLYPDTLWGNLLFNLANWIARNPTDQTGQLRGTQLYVSQGKGGGIFSQDSERHPGRLPVGPGTHFHPQTHRPRHPGDHALLRRRGTRPVQLAGGVQDLVAGAGQGSQAGGRSALRSVEEGTGRPAARNPVAVAGDDAKHFFPSMYRPSCSHEESTGRTHGPSGHAAETSPHSPPHFRLCRRRHSASPPPPAPEPGNPSRLHRRGDGGGAWRSRPGVRGSGGGAVQLVSCTRPFRSDHLIVG
ncbi:alpha/beta hydrolase-fold protein [Streptomyces sp. UMAF16]|nr:alpha/beta hydrolase-fold protein [Streptomyces sp. UMAF16]